MKKNIVLLVISSFFFFACNSPKDNTSKEQNGDTTFVNSTTESADGYYVKDPNLAPNIYVSGMLTNGEHATLVLEAKTNKGTVRIGKTITDETGKFQLDGAIVGLGLYQLRLLERKTTEQRNQKAIPLTLVPGDSVQLKLDFENFNLSPHYSGTEWATPLNEYFEKVHTFFKWQKSIPNPKQIQPDRLRKMVLQHKAPMDSYVQQQIKNNPANPANILLMNNLLPVMGLKYYDTENVEVLKHMQKAFEKSFPDSPITKNMGIKISQLEKNVNDFVNFSKKGIAPEINLPNPQGEYIKLSSLRGNYVLIDFWASWCGPCRAENPTNVRLWNKYKGENFKIYSVSLDNSKEKWVRAIKADNLSWKYHVSDLKGWETPLTQKYNFRAIPHTVLVNPNGKIIAQNLRGQTLANKLIEIFGK